MKFADDDAEANVLGTHRAPDREGSSAGDDESSPFVAAWLIVTRSGSRYVVGLDADDVWWFGGRNIANPGSVALPPQFWRIEPPTPWPPLLGAPAFLIADHDLAITDPMRVPGGGKVTSPIEIVVKLALDDETSS